MWYDKKKILKDNKDSFKFYSRVFFSQELYQHFAY